MINVLIDIIGGINPSDDFSGTKNPNNNIEIKFNTDTILLIILILALVFIATICIIDLIKIIKRHYKKRKNNKEHE